jgi:hypothetical protein
MKPYSGQRLPQASFKGSVTAKISKQNLYEAINTYFFIKNFLLNVMNSSIWRKHTILFVKNGVFWDVSPCGSCKNRCFGGT